MSRRAWIAFALPIIMVATVAAAQAPAEASAQEPAGTTTLKVAVIDGERVIAESNIGQGVQQQLRQLQERLNTEMTNKRQELDALIQEAQQLATTLNQEKLDEYEQRIERQQLDLQRMQEDAQREVARAAEQAQIQINAQLVPAVERLAAQEQIDLILDTRVEGILFFSNAIDLTDLFIEMVNEGSSGTGPGGS